MMLERSGKMDREEFSASIGEEQEDYIAYRRDEFLKLANTCINEYKNDPSEELFWRIDSALGRASALHFLLNRLPPFEYFEANKEYSEIKDSHQKNMALVNRNKKLEKTLMIKVLAKAGELLELTYAALTLGFGAGVGLFILSHIYKILEG